MFHWVIIWRMIKLKSWMDANRGKGRELAIRLGVPTSFVSKIVNGTKPIPVEHMAQIEAFTCGAITRMDMCPDRWQRIWPELAGYQQPQPAPTAAHSNEVA